MTSSCVGAGQSTERTRLGASHNPEVVGSNPTPLLEGPGGRNPKGPFVMPGDRDPRAHVSPTGVLDRRNPWSHFSGGS
jgi:hypothetical protein